MRKLVTLIILMLSGMAYANDFSQFQSGSQPLFDRNDLLHLNIQLPFKQLEKDRKGKPLYFPAQLTYADVEGKAVTIDIELRARGKMRRKSQTCDFPPLKIRLPTNRQATLFENQKTLKLVTHCNDKNINDQYVLKEYLAYRVYNLLTDYSLRARLVNISYREGEKLIAQRFAILLEHWERAAMRTDLTTIETTDAIDINKLSRFETSLMSLFQYMIGNDDWSALWPAADDECCHNVRHLLTTDGDLVPLPYDFDFSGLVETNYAVSRLGTKNVRKRRYLGYCAPQAGLEEAVNHFQSKRGEIFAQLLVLEESLSSREYKRTHKYFDRFYEVLDDPKKYEKRIAQRCRAD